MDKIAETYLKEMAMRHDNLPSVLNDSQQTRKNMYNNVSHKTYKTLSNGARITKNVGSGSHEGITVYHTLDDDSKEVIHKSVIAIDIDGKNKIEYNDSIDRVKDHQKLPKNHAADITYEHFLNSEYPMRTANVQSVYGNRMWHGLLDRAMNDGYHAYYSKKGVLKKITPENKQECLSSYFSKDLYAHHNHIIISKTLLNI